MILVLTAFLAAAQPDRSAIEWTLPGKFREACEKARASNRLIIIKGISFGVDEEGARCATKGDW